MGGMRHSSHDSVSQDGMAHDQRMPHGSKPSTGLLRGPARGDHPSTAAMMMCGSGGSGGSSSHSGMMWGDSSGGGLPLRRRRSELEEDNDDEQGLPAGAQRPRLDDAADQTSRGDRGACAPVLPVTDSDLASARSALKGALNPRWRAADSKGQAMGNTTACFGTPKDPQAVAWALARVGGCDGPCAFATCVCVCTLLVI